MPTDNLTEPDNLFLQTALSHSSEITPDLESITHPEASSALKVALEFTWRYLLNSDVMELPQEALR